MLLPVAALALPLLLIACSGDDKDDSSNSPTPTGAAAAASAAAGTQPTTGGGGISSGGPTPTVETEGAPGAFSGSTNPVKVDAQASAGAAVLSNVRSAAQDGFDRIVFEFKGNQLPGYSVKYADEAIACGSGLDQAPFIGGGTAPPALLIVNLRPSNAHDDSGQQTVVRDVNARLATITRAFRTCDFEAVVEYAVATTSEKPFRVSTLQNPTRLVIDIAQ